MRWATAGLFCVTGLLSGSIPSDALTATAMAEQALGGCYNPADYGAIPNDGGDDREAFQAAVDAAIAAHGKVCIGAGNWDLSQNPAPGGPNIGSIRVAGANGLVIRGTGPATRLRMLGSGGHSDWRLIDIREGSTNVKVLDLWLDGPGAGRPRSKPISCI